MGSRSNNGPIVVVAILLGVSGFIYLRSRLQPISADNVNDEWEETVPAEPKVPAGTAG